MQFRKVGKKVQCLSSEYIPVQKTENGNIVNGTGRSRTKMVASVPYNGFIGKEVDGLTSQEVADLKSWIADRKEKERVESARWNLTYATSGMKSAVRDFDCLQLEQSSVDDFYKSYDDLRKKLTAAGWKRTKPTKVKPSGVKGQSILPLDDA